MYRLYAAISIIIGMYLDSVLFAKVNIAGVVPDCVLVVIVCMGIQLGATEAAAAGCAAGLVIDILFGKAVGINAIAYMVAGSVGGIFYKKYFADNMIIPVLTVGGRFSYFGMLITYMVPSALMSAALCIPAHALLKPRLMLSAKKRYDRSAGGIK